jgi:leader peptidase (prepilin peptidase)/N-methyltransferase
MSSTLLWASVAGLYGLLFGSFANVVIWRYPRGESLVSPGSHCPACDAAIAWYDNVPVVSWLVLRGKCRRCGKPISIRYPIVELSSGLLWALGVLAFGVTPRAAFAIAFYYLLLILSAIDLDTFRLPNAIVGLMGAVALLGIGLSSVLGRGVLPLVDTAFLPWQASLIGAASSAGTALAIALLYRLLRNAEGFGMGDVKLLAVIGLYIGPHALMTLFVASIIGAVFGIAASRRSSEGLKAKIPFGPFLSASAIAVSVVGPQLWASYMRLVGG